MRTTDSRQQIKNMPALSYLSIVEQAMSNIQPGNHVTERLVPSPAQLNSLLKSLEATRDMPTTTNY